MDNSSRTHHSAEVAAQLEHGVGTVGPNWTVSLRASYDLLLTEMLGFCYDFVAA
jgi:hypothetical protein